MSGSSVVAITTMLTTVVAEAGAEAPLLISDRDELRAAINALPGGRSWHGIEATDAALEAVRADLALLDADAALPAGTATTLVSRLRDVHVQRVVVIAAAGGRGELSRQALIGLGFHRLGSSMDADRRRHWYEFDLASYKVTPDWLSPRNWANPELWDKYRW